MFRHLLWWSLVTFWICISSSSSFLSSSSLSSLSSSRWCEVLRTVVVKAADFAADAIWTTWAVDASRQRVAVVDWWTEVISHIQDNHWINKPIMIAKEEWAPFLPSFLPFFFSSALSPLPLLPFCYIDWCGCSWSSGCTGRWMTSWMYWCHHFILL